MATEIVLALSNSRYMCNSDCLNFRYLVNLLFGQIFLIKFSGDYIY